MLAVNVQESTTTTGTGNITLDGASENGRTFTSQYPVNFQFSYYIDDRVGNFEHGIGHLSGSATLVRDYVIRSSNSDALVNFAAGTKQVYNSKSETILTKPNAIADTGNLDPVYYGDQHIAATTSYTERSNQLWLSPFVNTNGAKFSSWAVYIKTASAGTSIRAGIYSVDFNTGLPTGAPILESDNISAGATGFVTLNFSNNVVGPTTAIRLPCYFFVGLAFEDAVISVPSISYTTNPKSWLGADSNGRGRSLYQLFTMGTPTATSPVLPTIGTVLERAENYPTGGFSI